METNHAIAVISAKGQSSRPLLQAKRRLHLGESGTSSSLTASMFVGGFLMSCLPPSDAIVNR
jgi:hypothetical protein